MGKCSETLIFFLKKKEEEDHIKSSHFFIANVY